MQQIQKKLYFIPAAFIIVRMWGTLQFIISIFVFNLKKVHVNGCVQKDYYPLYFSLAILQVKIRVNVHLVNNTDVKQLYSG